MAGTDGVNRPNVDDSLDERFTVVDGDASISA
ncbi:hypothetical protein ABIB29_003324 [Arthrobacter sp. UYEF36]